MKMYISTYCNFPHDMEDGKPVEHECRILPVAALQMEWEGNTHAAIEILEQEKNPKYMRRGKRLPKE